MTTMSKKGCVLLLSYLVAQSTAHAVEASLPQKTKGPRNYVQRLEAENTFQLSIDTHSPKFNTTHREPQDGPVTVTLVSGADAELIAKAKTIPSRPDRIWVDVYLVNKSKASLLDLTMMVKGPANNVNVDPFSDLAFDGPHPLGGVAAQGVAHAAFTVPVGTDPVSVQVAFNGKPHSSEAVNATPIAVTFDGKEVWSLLSDAKKIFVADTQKDALLDAIEMPGIPEKLAITPDDKQILVVCSDTNQVVVIDRATRKIVQILKDEELGRDLRNILVSQDGNYVYIDGYVSDTVTRLARSQDGVLSIDKTIKVGRRPVGLSLSADGKVLYAAHFLPRGTPDDNETFVSVIATDPFAFHHEVVWRDLGNRKESKCLSAKFNKEPESLLFEGTATQLAGVFLPPAGDLGWVPGLRVGPTALWEVPAGKMIPAIAPAIFSPGFAFFIDARTLDSSAIKYSPLVLDAPDSTLEFLRCAKFGYDAESPTHTPVKGEAVEAQYNDGAAVPTGSTGLSESGVTRFVAFTKGGRRALMLSYTADEIQVLDAVTQHSVEKNHTLLSGSNPIGMALTPDGKKAFVAYENSLFTSVLDISQLADPSALPPTTHVPFEYRVTPRPSNSILTTSHLVRFTESVPTTAPIIETKQIQLLTEDVLAPEVRRGKILFDSSNPTKFPKLTRSRQAACATCHPGGGNDGAVWATVEGERRTMALRGGVGTRGWLHQSGTHRDIGEFVRSIVPERLGGTGLDEPDYNALAQYVAFHIPKLQSPVTEPARVARGAALFSERCAGCHQGAGLTSGKVDPKDPLGGGLASGPGLFDLGTSSPSAFVLLPSFFTAQLPPQAHTLYDLIRGDRDLGANDPVQQQIGFRSRPERKKEQFRAPTLINVWDNVLFLHNGRFSDLESTVRFIDNAVGAELNDEQIADVVEYLKSL